MENINQKNEINSVWNKLKFCHENNIDIPMLNRFGTLKEDLEIDKEISRDIYKIKEWIEINKPTKISWKRKA